MDALAPPALQPRNMSVMPSTPGYGAVPEPAPLAVPPGVSPAMWLQLPPEQQMHYWSMLQGMESARSGPPAYGPPVVKSDSIKL